MPKITIGAGKGKVVQTSGKYLSIVNSTGSFKIESPIFGSVIGELGRQLELDNVRDVLFNNTSDKPLNVEYEVANIKVHISGKGGSVAIENLPAVQAVSFESTTFEVSNLPDVQKVALQSNTVEVSNLPSVQKVVLESNIVEVVTASRYLPLPPADFVGGDVVIPKNDSRKTLVIMADKNNQGQIWVGGSNVGIPLSADREFNLSSTAAVTLHASVTTDTCYLAEVTK